MKTRNLQLDIFKCFAIVVIVSAHYLSTPYWLIIWAIPLLVLVTSSLYNQSAHRLTIIKITKKMLWLALLIFSFTVLAAIAMRSNLNFSWTINFWLLRNPHLGNLWYFLVYIQVLSIIFAFGKIKKFNFAKWQWGLIFFAFTQLFSYSLLHFFGRGVSIISLSWLFIIWLGLYHYAEIKKFFQKSFEKNFSRFIFSMFATTSLLILSVKLGGEQYKVFAEQRSHDFIFPNFLFQLIALALLFQISTLLVNLTPKTALALGIVGRFSLYIYLLHWGIGHSLTNLPPIINVMISLGLPIVVGVLLEKVNKKIFA